MAGSERLFKKVKTIKNNKMTSHKILTLLFLTVFLSSCGKKPAVVFSTGPGNFNAGWEFVKDPTGNISPELFQKTDDKTSGWQKVSLPHTSNIEPVDSPEKQWQGIARYRKFFTVPEQFEGKSISLNFDGAMQVAKVYLNGELIQTHWGGYLPFQVKLDGKVKFGKVNCVLVELDNRDYPVVPPGKPLATLDFNYYSGLYRNVTIEVKNKLHISDPITANRVAGGGLLVTYSEVSDQSAKINVQVDVENENTNIITASLQISLADASEKTVLSEEVASENIPASGFFQFKKEFSVQNPKLWSPDSPNLYLLKVKVMSGKTVVDSISEKIGIRTFYFSAKDGFVLNGQKLKLRGTNRHQEYPYIGNALSDNAQYRDAYKIKQAGFNFVRSSHYPQSPAYLAACDELGILVMDAIPGWQFVGNEEFQNNSIRDVRETVRRDRNHPSIVLWEASLNESGMPKPFMERAHQAVHEELPFTNIYTAGWIDDVYDVFIPARQHAKPPYYWNKYAQDKPIVIAEYGDWEYYAQNAGFNQTAYADLKQDERNSRQLRGFGQKRLAQQAFNYQESHNDNLNGPAAGDANWLMFDYKRGCAPDIESSGIMDIFRLPKFAFYFYASQAEQANPMIYIANFWNDPKFKGVKVYSNCDEVELSLNGKVIARQRPDQDRNSTNLKHAPFTFSIPEFIAGKLEAKGYINGKEAVKTERKTPGAPAKITLSVDLSGKELQAGKNDVIFVYASVTDADGTVIPDDIRPVTFTIEGDCELVGDNPRKAEAGISTILLIAGKTSGMVKVKASAEGLTGDEIVVNVR
jgi:beta-galactosidase